MEKVVDSNILIHGRGSLQGSLYTVPGVMEELKSSEARMKFDSLEIDVGEPSEESLRKVREKSREINSPTSDVDEKLVALTQDLGCKLLTDDKAAQNLALHLDLDFSGFLEDAVEEKRCWEKVCSNCGAEIEDTPCPECGTNSSRRKPGPCS